MTSSDSATKLITPNQALEIIESWALTDKSNPDFYLLRSAASVLIAEVRRLKKMAPIEVSDEAQDAPLAKVVDESILNGLNYAQLHFMKNVEGGERKQISDYLRSQVAVNVVANNEVPEAPPFALEVVDDPGYWLGCFETAEAAQATAVAIGLPVVNALSDTQLQNRSYKVQY